MAQLKDLLVNGISRLVGDVFLDKLNAPTTSNGTTYGLGTNGQVLKSNCNSIYWSDDNTLSLDKTDTAVSGQYVSAVSQSDGIITVTRANFSPSLTLTEGNSSTAPKIKVTVNTKTSDDITLTTASTSVYGVTKLNDGVSSTSTALAATANSVKIAYDAAILKSIGTTKGDILYWSASGSPARLGIGTAGQILKATTAGPTWSDSSVDTLTTARIGRAHV